MIGISPRRPRVRPPAARAVGVLLAAVLAALAALPSVLHAQAPTDQPTLPAPADNSTVTPASTPSTDTISPLLTPGSPLSPHPSVPDASLLPDSTPRPEPLPPLPVPNQTGSSLNPATSGAPLTNGAPGTTPTTDTAGPGATTTTNTGAVRRFQYAFRLTTGVTYDDNVFLTNSGSTPGTNSQRSGFSRADVYFFIEPSVSLGYGDFLTRATNYIEFDYTADALLYTKNTDQDTVEHFFNLQGAYHFAQITLTLTQGIQLLDSTDLGSANSGGLLGAASTTPTTSQVNLDTSRRTGLDVFTTRLDANYAFSDKTSIDLDGYFSAYDYQTLISSDTIAADAYFNYSPTGKITLGLGVTGGYTIQDAPAPDETYEQANLRLSYTATSKLSLAGSVGIEFRENSGSSGTEVNPIFNLTLSYAPFDSTALSLAANRNVDTSAVLTGENFDTTGFTFTISQRFFQRVNVNLALGYTHSTYTDAGGSSSTNVGRTDDYYFVQPGLDYSIRDNLSAGIFYIHRQNTSTLVGNSFNDNQIGARISLNF